MRTERKRRRARRHCSNKRRLKNQRSFKKMTSVPISFTNVGSGYTIVTQVVPTSTASASAGEHFPQIRSPLQRFLKGEPKALGTVQIMSGVMTILFGIVIAIYPWPRSVYTGVIYWGSLLHISAGSLAVSGSNKLNACVVKAALVVNIFSMVAAGIAIICFFLDLVIGPRSFRCCYYDDDKPICSPPYERSTSGITGVLLVFSLLQFVISIAISAFTCKAICTNETTVNVFTVVPNTESDVRVVSSFPAYQEQPGFGTMDAITLPPPVESPPAYSEKS